MSLMRTAILKASANPWMRKNAPRYGFLRRTVTRFMPGENIDDALAAARQLAEKRIATLVTHLGENIEDRSEAESVTNHYLDVLKRITADSLPTEVSVKLAQLGLDLDREFCYANLATLIEATPPDAITSWTVAVSIPPIANQGTRSVSRAARTRARPPAAASLFVGVPWMAPTPK